MNGIAFQVLPFLELVLEYDACYKTNGENDDVQGEREGIGENLLQTNFLQYVSPKTRKVIQRI